MTMTMTTKTITMPLSAAVLRCLVSLFVVLLSVSPAAGHKHVPNLPWGDINVLIVTDVHSWVNSHAAKEKGLDVDYGALLSFHHRLQTYAEINGNKPFFFAMNGDFMDGTGLTRHPPRDLISVLKKMPFDVMNIGNHELYFESTVDAIEEPHTGLVDHFQDAYLTTNVVLANRNSEQGGNSNVGFRYKMLETETSTTVPDPDDPTLTTTVYRKIRVLTFGFLYNMEDHCQNVDVQRVEDVVTSDWFVGLLQTHKHHLNAVLVLAHMDVVDPLVRVILAALREHLGDDMPVQFITGHTHYRGYHIIDDMATSAEAGRYLDTVGFVSFPAKVIDQNDTNADNAVVVSLPDNSTVTVNATDVLVNSTDTSNTTITNNNTNGTLPITPSPPLNPDDDDTNDVDKPNKPNTTALFQHVFLDANIHTLAHDVLQFHFDFELWTHEGRALQRMIHRTRQKLGLNTVLGCTNTSLYLKSPLQEPDSLWGFFRTKVVASFFFENDPTKVLFINKDGFRYDLLAGDITLDDVVGVAPFYDTIFTIADGLTGSEMKQILGHDPYTTGLPSTITSVDAFDDKTKYELFTVDFEREKWGKVVQDVTGRPAQIKALNTTVTKLWEDYVQAQLADGCHTPVVPIVYQNLNDNTNGMAPVIVAIISLVVLTVSGLVLMTVFRVVRRVLRYGRYDQTATGTVLSPFPGQGKNGGTLDSDGHDDDDDYETDDEREDFEII